MSVWEVIAILLAGVAAGTINTVVGSGTLITFPTLLAFGIPPVTANVSNTIGLVLNGQPVGTFVQSTTSGAAAGSATFNGVGAGTYTAQVANVATSEAEAVALVDKAKANGFIGVKFYGTLNPAWLPAAIKEAHKLGLHVHGHIPAGIRPIDAINDGYDEITHINWIMMQAMPDSVIATDNGLPRFYGPGQYAAGLSFPSAVQVCAGRVPGEGAGAGRDCA